MSTGRQKSQHKATANKRALDAFPDRIDLRDWPYQPTLAPLPDEIVNCAGVPKILDQGAEGACTGFALAAVIDFLLARRGGRHQVSPRMLYEMARCYDEWPGEKYDGSSARGAMKGWARHGVCEQARWKDGLAGRAHLTPEISMAALAVPCGAYYRVNHREVRDVHAALSEVGAIYCTLMVHQGWDEPGPLKVKIDGNGSGKPLQLPVIRRKGVADGGHAVAFVGYTRDGFIVQNSWGTGWGSRGFALLPYEDYLLHATDIWVAQLGVPLTLDLWKSKQGADTRSGRFRGRREIPLAEIRPYTVDVGNNGELSETGDYWTSEADLERLFMEAIPQAAAERGWKRKRVMFFLHGGLNSEDDTAKRVVALRDKCLANEIYPLHVMWETGAIETFRHIIGDLFTSADEKAGGRFLDGMREAKDRVLELTASAVGKRMWDEMKENAARASDRKMGAMQLMQKHALASLGLVSPEERATWEVHVVAHSAGSILFASVAKLLCSLGIEFKTLQLFAPAIRIDEFKATVLDLIKDGSCPRPRIYNLSRKLELDDTVGPYGKSLLWLVSNSFEDVRGTPLLGMQDFLRSERSLLQHVDIVESIGSETASETHGGFDNDATTMNSALTQILGKKPADPFTPRDLDY